MNQEEQEFLKASASAAFDLAWSIVKNAGSSAWERGKIEKAMASYAERYNQRHGQINVLGMGHPIFLKDIYTEVNVVSGDFLRRFMSIEEMAAVFDQEGERGFGMHLRSPRQPGISAANRIQFLNILGQPGAGKSTFLRRVGLEALLPRRSMTDQFKDSFRKMFQHEPRTVTYSEYEHDCIPVLIELRRFREGDIDLLDLIQREFSVCGFPDSPQFIERALNHGRLLVLLDGLDEVPSQRVDQVIDHVRDFVDKHTTPEGVLSGSKKISRSKTNRFITSCRTAFYKSYFTRFTDVVLADFDDGQIESFVTHWFSNQDPSARVAEAFLAILRQPAHRATLELARTPLLLTFLCLVYDSSQRLPANRSHLYRRALDVLVERWAAEKRVHHDPVYQDLHPEFELQMLAEIAGPAYSEGQIFFSKRGLEQSISGFLIGELNAPKTLNASAVLQAIEVQQGLIVQRAEDVYSFSHLTLQEYLTATYFVENGKVDELVTRYLYSPRWEEVFLLVAGMLGKADDLLSWMLDRTDAFVSSFKRTIDLLTWVQRCTHGSGVITDGVVMRTSALLYVLSRNRDLEIGREVDRLVARAREETQRIAALLLSSRDQVDLPLRSSDYESYSSPDIHRWDIENLRGLTDYLRLIRLIIRCKEAAMRVTVDAWESLAPRILTPPASDNVEQQSESHSLRRPG
jgi:NACHT domain